MFSKKGTIRQPFFSFRKKLFFSFQNNLTTKQVYLLCSNIWLSVTYKKALVKLPIIKCSNCYKLMSEEIDNLPKVL